LVSRAHAKEAASAPVTPDEALQRLIDGNARYVANAPINTDHSVGRSNRALGQQPFAAIVSCADSRVAPELIFDQGPGELFVVRVAGNFINEEGLASLEYGAAVLGIKTIVVLGHTSCGAVDATIKSVQDDTLPPGHLPSLVNAIRPAVEQAIAGQLKKRRTGRIEREQIGPLSRRKRAAVAAERARTPLHRGPIEFPAARLAGVGHHHAQPVAQPLRIFELAQLTGNPDADVGIGTDAEHAAGGALIVASARATSSR
jgi:carbonic anhydrase